MKKQNDFLFEIGCEELPIAAVKSLSNALKTNMTDALKKASLNFDAIQSFGTPRRLALLIKNLDVQQPDKTLERFGPAESSAFKDGKPTPAIEGFAKSCGVSIDNLTTQDTPKGRRLYCCVKQAGQNTAHLLPSLIESAIKLLPISKPMRWGEHDINFARPVHWIVMLLGNEIIPATILGKTAANITYGHRFLSPQSIELNEPQQYESLLERQGKVIADFSKRRAMIKQAAENAAKVFGQAVIPDGLLDQVTALVEYPVAYVGKFDRRFLTVPQEALMLSMQTHQKYFPITDQDGKLQPCFVLISNIESKDKQVVISGNEKVINARLEDAKFFFDLDKKAMDDGTGTGLTERKDRLRKMIFHPKLGSIQDKVNRIQLISCKIDKALGSENKAESIALTTSTLACKGDLTTQMVYEFPELQGIMGQKYAPFDTELKKSLSEPDKWIEQVANALFEQYRPRFSGDDLPESKLGIILSLSDKIDTLIGIFGINQLPTGNKDPFALRRAAQGVLRILIEKELPINLYQLLNQASDIFAKENITLENKNVVNDVFEFIMQRLKVYYQDQGIFSNFFAAVHALMIDSNYKNKMDLPFVLANFERRIRALQIFANLPEAEALASASKRVRNILAKNDSENPRINKTLFELPAETNLFNAIERQTIKINASCEMQNYQEALCQLSTLKTPIDQFFDDVMVMVDDESVRNNRLSLLEKLNHLFVLVADLSFTT